MTRAKKPANYCVQANLQLASNLFIRVLCRDCGTVLALEEDDILNVNLGRTGGNILNITVPPFCPVCLKQKYYAAMGEYC